MIGTISLPLSEHIISQISKKVKSTSWWSSFVTSMTTCFFRLMENRNYSRGCFFSIGDFFLSFADSDDSHNSKGRERTIFYSTLPLPPAHEHSDIYFATLYVRWLSHFFNRTACVYQTATQWDLPYQITIWLIDDMMLIFVCLLVDLIQGFCQSSLTLETSGLEPASAIILVLQVNRLIQGR